MSASNPFFAPKTALITGASSGIGLELAHLFARDGYRLVLVARNRGALRELGDELQSRYSVEVGFRRKTWLILPRRSSFTRNCRNPASFSTCW